jgi:hypothetical protein
MSLSQKQQIEKATAEIFLPLYNQRFGTSFAILELSDAPDVICQDTVTGAMLYLEIGLVEDLKGEIADELKRGKQTGESEYIMPVRSLYDDALPNYRKVIQKKMQSAYGKDTALVLRQVSPIWGPDEWRILAAAHLPDLLQGSQAKFGAGVWVICVDSKTWPASDAIVCLSDGLQ